MRTCLALVILTLSLIAVGCASKPILIPEPHRLPEVIKSTTLEGMQPFVGVSDEKCRSEQEARNAAWMDAMAKAGKQVFTYIESVTRSWVKEERENLKIDIKTAFESAKEGISYVPLKGLKLGDEFAWENPDGTYKARVTLLADMAQLMEDMKELRKEAETAGVIAERAVRVLKSQVREKMQKAEAPFLPPQKLELLAKTLVPYKELQKAQASIQNARQAAAKRDWLKALAHYEEIPKKNGDAPTDDSPVPDVDHAYGQTWELLREAAKMLESAQKLMDTRKLVSAQKLLDEFHQRMGDAAGPFTHIRTGEILSLSPLPSLLGKQLDALKQEAEDAFQRGEDALKAGDMANAMQAYHEALEANVEHPRAQQRLDETLRIFATATLEADPVELTIPSRIAIKENLSVSLKSSDGQLLPMPIAFRFEESGIDAEMVTDLLDVVSSTGTLTINKIRQSPADTNKFHLLATPWPQAMSNLDKMLISRLQSVLEKHIISIPVTLKPPSLAVLLNFTSADVSQERMSEFRGNLEDKLRQKKYEIVEKSDVNTMEVRGELRMSSAPVGSIITLNLGITLAFWHDSRALAENVEISSGAQMDISEDDAFAAAQQIAIQKCATEIEKQMKKALGE